MHLKTLKIYNESLDLVKEILVETVLQPDNLQCQEELDDMEKYNVSTIVCDEKLYYFKRLFKDGGSVLQLFYCDMSIEKKFDEFQVDDGYCFVETEPGDKFLKQYNSLFSINIDTTTLSNEHDRFKTEKNFLDDHVVLF